MSRIETIERYGLSRDECEGTGRLCRTCGDELLRCEQDFCGLCMVVVEAEVAGIEIVPESRRKRERELGAAA